MSSLLLIPSFFRLCASIRKFHSPSLESALNSKSIFGKYKAKIIQKKYKTGLFEIPQLTIVEGFKDLEEECIRNTESLVKEIHSPIRIRPLIRVFDDLSDELCRVADMAEFVRQAHPNVRFRHAATSTCLKINGLVEKLNTDRKLYEALLQVFNSEDSCIQSSVDKHVAKLFLFDFQLSGIHLNERARQAVVSLNENILHRGQSFAFGANQPSFFSKSSFPSKYLPYFTVNDDHVFVNGLQTESSDENLRELTYKMYYRNHSVQEELLMDLLRDRYTLAQLCGYKTYAHRSTIDSLARSPDNISRFLNTLHTELFSIVTKDIEYMSKMKSQTINSNNGSRTLQVWDIPYLTRRARQIYIKDIHKMEEYFSLGTVMEGLNDILQKVLGVSFVLDEIAEGETWHSDVFKIAVREVKEPKCLLGHIYCDFFPRAGKAFQDCHFTIQGGRSLSESEYQNPIVVLMLNLPTPSWNKPSLLSLSLIDNLFHEMGHAIHSMLGRTKYQHVTGTRCSTDFAEVPSTLMEYFSSDPRVLHSFSKHYKSGEQLPLTAIIKYISIKNLFFSLEIQTQLMYSELDQILHGFLPTNGSSTDVLLSLYEDKYTSHPRPPKETAWQLRFSHLVGYGSRYYSYLMARSVASTIWQKFFAADPYSYSSGNKYRFECLAHGGGKPSYDIISDFLGQEINEDILVKSLMVEISDKHQRSNSELNL